MLLQIEKFKNSLEAAAYNYPFYENPEAQWGRTQSRLIIEFVNRNQRAPSAQHQGLLFAEFYIRRESERDGAGSDLRRSPVPPLSAVSIFVLSHSALLYLIPCACILPPSRPKSGTAGVASRPPLAFRCGSCGGCFLPLWTYPPSLHPLSPRLLPSASFSRETWHIIGTMVCLQLSQCKPSKAFADSN